MMLPNSTQKPSPLNQRKEAIQQLDISNVGEESEEPAETQEDMPGVWMSPNSHSWRYCSEQV
jgi:hypothetical protein